MRNKLGAAVIVIGTAVAIGVLLQATPAFVFISPQTISISPSNEAIIPYHSAAAAGPIEIKVKVDEKGYSTSDYDLTAFLIDPNGVATQAAHSAITTSTGSGGIVLSALVVYPFWAQRQDFRSLADNTLKATWTGKYKLAGFAFPRTFQTTALIKFPYMILKEQGSVQNGGGSIDVNLSGPFDFPVRVSLVQSNLNLPVTSLTIQPNTADGSFSATPNPPHCPPHPEACSPPYCPCAGFGFVGATAAPDDPGASTFATASLCVTIQCIPGP